MTIKNYRPGLESDSSPKKKLILGIVALACIFGIGFVLDFTTSSINKPQEEPPASQPADLPAKDAANEDKDEEPSPTDNADSKDQSEEGGKSGQIEIGGTSFSSASNLDPLSQEQKTSLGEYVSAYLDTEGIDPTSVVVDVARRAYVDQQSTRVSLYVQGHDLHLNCDLDLMYGAWKVTGQTSAELKDELDQARKDVEAAKKAEEDAKKRLDEELQRQQQEAQMQEEA